MAMASFFNVGNLGNLGVNPFLTFVGQKIEECTDGYQASENWALFMEICDLINETEEGPKDAVRAIKKRLQQNAGKNYKTVMFTLTLLETCVKNCNKKFHIQVCSKDFVQELIKLIGPKNDPPTVVQEKVLGLIQSWADAFYNIPECSAVVHMYKDLHAKGVEFPMTDLDTMAPIHTPRKNMPTWEQKNMEKGNAFVDKRDHVIPDFIPQKGAHLEASPQFSGHLNSEQIVKLHSELDIVQSNMTVMNEMLNEPTSHIESPDDVQLLTELYETCKRMQERVAELIVELDGEEITADLLRVNDMLHNLFLRYKRWEKNREAMLSKENQTILNKEEPASLIDLSDNEDDAQNHLVNKVLSLGISTIDAPIKPVAPAVTSVAPAAYSASPAASSSFSPNRNANVTTNPEFDMFAQSRNVTYESSRKIGSTYEDNLKSDQLVGGLASAAQIRMQTHSAQPPSLQQTEPPSMMHRESDFDEMAAWLGDAVPPPLERDSLTSSEFDRFLAERAAAVENSSPSERKPHKPT